MRALRILMIGLAVVVFSVPSAADDAADDGGFSREGFYVSVSGVYVSERWDGTREDSGAQDTEGINVRVGSRVNQWASAEFELELIDNFSPTDTETYGMLNISLNTRVYPIEGRFQPYLLGGLGIIATISHNRGPDSNVAQSNADWAIRSGGGIDIYYTSQVGVTFEAVHVFTIGDIKDNDHYSMGLGVFYRF